MLRTRFKTVTNYRREQDMDEAMPNTEIGGRVASWGSLRVNQPDWVAQKRLSALAQIGLERHRDLADTPLLSELVSNDRDRALMTFVSLSGLVLIFFMSKKRTSGLIALGVGAVLSYAVYAIWVP